MKITCLAIAMIPHHTPKLFGIIPADFVNYISDPQTWVNTLILYFCGLLVYLLAMIVFEAVQKTWCNAWHRHRQRQEIERQWLAEVREMVASEPEADRELLYQQWQEIQAA